MKKLLLGIIDFRKNALEEYRSKFSQLALKGQSPDALLISCCDSRVVPNVFASTDPGDLFVLRNIGNLVPPHNVNSQSSTDNSTIAAIEYSIFTLNILDIIICGHSECGAMSTLLENKANSKNCSLDNWLHHAYPAYDKLQQGHLHNSSLTPHNKLSQINVIQQLEHLKTYPYISDRLQNNKLRIHGWWFDLASADIHCYEPTSGKFVLLDEAQANAILASLENTQNSDTTS